MSRYSDVAGVRITPTNVEFKDTEPNVLRRINITVKNVSKISKSIRYYAPQNTKVRPPTRNRLSLSLHTFNSKKRSLICSDRRYVYVIDML